MPNDDQYHQMRMNGMSPSGLPIREPIQCFEDNEIGMTMEDTKLTQLADGTWKATAKIGTLFGSEVEGELSGAGATKEQALAKLAEERKNLNDSLWA